MTLSITQTFLITVLLIGISVFVLMVFSAFIGYATAQLQKKQGTAQIGLLQWYLLGLITLWFAIALTTSIANLMSFSLVLPFVLIPIIVGTLLSFTPQLRELIKAVPTHWLIFLQVYRVAGGLFIFPYLTEGILIPITISNLFYFKQEATNEIVSPC